MLYMTTDEIEEFKFVFDVTINSKGKIVGKNDIDLKIVASGEDIQNWFGDATKRIEIENYFGNGCIERMDFSYDYYLTNTQLNAVLEEVATWLYTNTEYSSVSDFISSSADASLKEELIDIYENVNWQCDAV